MLMASALMLLNIKRYQSNKSIMACTKLVFRIFSNLFQNIIPINYQKQQ